MKLIKFPEQTVVYAEHQTEYAPLPAFQYAKDVEGKVVCCWQLTWRDRLRLLFTGKLWHQVLTFHGPLQPQMLFLDKPFTLEDVLARHQEQKEIAGRKCFENELRAKYGDRVRERQAFMDARNYPPNDRRRCVKVDPEDFQRCKELGILFLGGVRIVDDNHQSAV